jgi:hypothetical protein
LHKKSFIPRLSYLSAMAPEMIEVENEEVAALKKNLK